MKNGFYDDIWSPVEGCLHGCEYCYARRDLERAGRNFNPVFYEDRLDEPSHMRPQTLFVTHYCDLFGEWVPREWIEKIVNECRALPMHTFLFITKNPKRYWEVVWPSNCILGVTIESPDKWDRARAIYYLPYRKMASIEPIMGDFTGYDFSMFNQVVIGALFGEANPPKGEWVNSIKHDNIYYKHSVRKYLK